MNPFKHYKAIVAGIGMIVCVFLLTRYATVRAAQVVIGLDTPPMRALRQLREDSLEPPSIRSDNSIPRVVSVQVPIPCAMPEDPVIRALWFVTRYRDMYGLDYPSSQLYLKRIRSDDRDGQHLFFGQRQGDIPVFAGELAVHLAGGLVIGTNGHYLREIPQFPAPQIAALDAQSIAFRNAGEHAEAVGEPKLMYFNRSLYTGGEADSLAGRFARAQRR
jgi:hypothetical protein